MMEISRRGFLTKIGVTLGLSAITQGLAWAANPICRRYISAYTNNNDEHFAALFDEQGEQRARFPLNSRGHSFCVSPDQRYIACFARRPGSWIELIDAQTATKKAVLKASKGRHFYGHGVFSKDGAYLYASENDYAEGRGVIGIYSLENGLARVGEIPSYGVGPHEIGLLSDGKTLVVANGGILTHPEYGRQKLNLDSMEPNLSYISLDGGKLIKQFSPPHSKISLRHIAITKNDTVMIVAQYQGDKTDSQPLIFSHRLNLHDNLMTFSGDTPQSLLRLKQYIASVCVSADGRIALTSSPRGDLVTLWDIDKTEWIADIRVTDVGGVAAHPNLRTFVLSSGNGNLYSLNAETLVLSQLSRNANRHWDNHLVSV